MKKDKNSNTVKQDMKTDKAAIFISKHLSLFTRNIYITFSRARAGLN